MTVLKALKKMFGKSEVEQLASSPIASSPAAVGPAKGDPRANIAENPAPASTPVQGQQAEAQAAKPERPRRERAPKPPVKPWKLEDFAVEPQEGKTRFHDFKLSPELMHAIHDLGFPYCTPIQAGVLGFTLSGKDAIGRAQTGTGKTAAFALPILHHLCSNRRPQIGRAHV